MAMPMYLLWCFTQKEIFFFFIFHGFLFLLLDLVSFFLMASIFLMATSSGFEIAGERERGGRQRNEKPKERDGEGKRGETKRKK